MDTYERVAAILELLANGEAVQLGEFGDNAESTDADDEAVMIRELAYSLQVPAAP